MGVAVIGMELAAVLVAVLAFGWPVLLVGVPLLVVTLVALAVVRLWELAQRRLERERAARWDKTAALPEGLMSGFFAVSAIPDQPALPPVDVPILRTARGWAQDTARNWTHGSVRGWARDASRGWAKGVGRVRDRQRPVGTAPGSRRPAPGVRPVQRVRALSGRLPLRVRPPR